MARDRNKLKEWKKASAIKKQMLAVEMLGGRCDTCDKEVTEDTLVCFDFHHLDNTDKDATIGALLTGGYSLKKVLEEAQKCVIMCACCHRLHHKEYGFRGGN
jgi:hypothetical protein